MTQSEPKAAYSFTKVVVDDLDAMAAYYGEVFGLTEVRRVKAEIAGEGIDEIMLGLDGSLAGGLILLKWLDRAAPTSGEVILGFLTADISALVARAEAAGGTVREAPRMSLEAGLVVGFIADPEGHLAEVIERP
jgi:predicted enzyme related to lactoylglutathione lyase